LPRSVTPRMGELIGPQFIVNFRKGAGTALAAVIACLDAELKMSLGDDVIRKRLLSHGATIRHGTPAEAGALMKSEMEKGAKVVRATGNRVYGRLL